MGCSNPTPIIPNPFIDNPEFQKIDDIETELFKSFDIDNQDENKNDFEGIRLNYLSKYYLIPKKDELTTKYSNQIIMITGRDINPLNLKEKNNSAIQNAISKSKDIITKYENQIIPISFHLNLSQHIFPEYNYTLKLKSNSNSNEERTIDFNKSYSLLFIFLNQEKDTIIKKIIEIKDYEKKIEKKFEKKKEETFELILMVKENKKELHDYLKSNNINKFYILTNKEKNIMESFELNDFKSYKCIFYNKSSEISLILEDNIEYLTEEMIEYYLKRNSEQEYNKYNNKNKKNFKRVLEQDEFKVILSQFTREFNLEIEFRDIGKKKYPVNIRFKYHEIDKDIALKIIVELKKIMENNNIKKYFISKFVECDINERNEILMKQSQDKDKIIEELKKKSEEDKQNYSKKIQLLEEDKKKNLKKIKILEEDKEENSKKIRILKKDKEDNTKKIQKLEDEKKINLEKITKLEEEKQGYSQKIKKLEEDKKIKEEYAKKIKKLEKDQEESAKKITKLKEEKDELANTIKINEDEKKNTRILTIKTDDENIYYCLTCQITDNFSKIEEDFFKKYPQYKYKKYSFSYKNNNIDSSDKLQKLNFQNNDVIKFKTIN